MLYPLTTQLLPKIWQNNTATACTSHLRPCTDDWQLGQEHKSWLITSLQVRISEAFCHRRGAEDAGFESFFLFSLRPLRLGGELWVITSKSLLT